DHGSETFAFKSFFGSPEAVVFFFEVEENDFIGMDTKANESGRKEVAAGADPEGGAFGFHHFGEEGHEESIGGGQVFGLGKDEFVGGAKGEFMLRESLADGPQR